MQPASASALGYAALAALILWRVVVRFRRAVGRQRLSRYRAPITFAIYGLIVWLLARGLWGHPGLAAELLVAAIAGAALGQVAIRRTRFEPSPQGLYYTPYSPIALSLAVLFAARVAYRVFEIASAGPGQAGGLRGFIQSPLTLAAFGLLVGYNLYYTACLARWRHRVLAAKRRRDSAP